jgi:hypothetical protein
MPKNRAGIERKYWWLDALHHHTQGRVEVVHGIFRPRKHRFYIEREELDNLARSGIAVDPDRTDHTPTFHPQLRIHEEKQTDVMLATSLVADAALGAARSSAAAPRQATGDHRTNRRPTPSACDAAVIVSADIDFLPAAELAAGIFQCPVAAAFIFPRTGYPLTEVVGSRDLSVFTLEVPEQELRACMLPAVVRLPDGRSIELQKLMNSHFNKAKAAHR